MVVLIMGIFLGWPTDKRLIVIDLFQSLPRKPLCGGAHYYFLGAIQDHYHYGWLHIFQKKIIYVV